MKTTMKSLWLYQYVMVNVGGKWEDGDIRHTNNYRDAGLLPRGYWHFFAAIFITFPSAEKA